MPITQDNVKSLKWYPLSPLIAWYRWSSVDVHLASAGDRGARPPPPRSGSLPGLLRGMQAHKPQLLVKPTGQTAQEINQKRKKEAQRSL